MLNINTYDRITLKDSSSLPQDYYSVSKYDQFQLRDYSILPSSFTIDSHDIFTIREFYVPSEINDKFGLKEYLVINIADVTVVTVTVSDKLTFKDQAIGQIPITYINNYDNLGVKDLSQLESFYQINLSDKFNLKELVSEICNLSLSMSDKLSVNDNISQIVDKYHVSKEEVFNFVETGYPFVGLYQIDKFDLFTLKENAQTIMPTNQISCIDIIGIKDNISYKIPTIYIDKHDILKLVDTLKNIQSLTGPPVVITDIATIRDYINILVTFKGRIFTLEPEGIMFTA